MLGCSAVVKSARDVVVLVLLLTDDVIVAHNLALPAHDSEFIGLG